MLKRRNDGKNISLREKKRSQKKSLKIRNERNQIRTELICGRNYSHSTRLAERNLISSFIIKIVGQQL